jgi:hypothetical protein
VTCTAEGVELEVVVDVEVEVGGGGGDERALGPWGWVARSTGSALLKSGDERACKVDLASCRSSSFGLQRLQWLQELHDLQLNDQAPRSPSCLDRIV